MPKMTAVRPPVALRYAITLHWPRPCPDADIYVEVVIECHRCLSRVHARRRPGERCMAGAANKRRCRGVQVSAPFVDPLSKVGSSW